MNNHIWSLNLNLVFKPTLFNLLLVALAQTHSYCHVMSMHHIVHCIDCKFLLCCRYLFPPGRRCSDVVIVDTDEDSMLSSECQASKTPMFIPIQSHSLSPALFYCIRTTTIHLLLAAVAEPLYPLHDLSLPQ